MVQAKTEAETKLYEAISDQHARRAEEPAIAAQPELRAEMEAAKRRGDQEAVATAMDKIMDNLDKFCRAPQF